MISISADDETGGSNDALIPCKPLTEKLSYLNVNVYIFQKASAIPIRVIIVILQSGETSE